jgi:hypothetical protein
MPDTISEFDGCTMLARLFRSRGYAIQRNVWFREYGVEFHIDGWDPKARVGFEFLTSEDDDHDDLSLEEYNSLTAAQMRGELALFIIDEVEPLSAADLLAEANDFLDEVEANRRPATKKGARKRPAAKKAVTRSAIAKKAAKQSGPTSATAPRSTKKAVKAKKAAKVKKAARKAGTKAVKKPPGKARKPVKKKTGRSR